MAKKPYAKPKLIQYGSVSKLTAAKTKPIMDGSSAKAMT